jgi:hypothetical protein
MGRSAPCQKAKAATPITANPPMKSCCNHTGRGDRDELRLSALTMTLRPVSFVELYFTARKGTSADHESAAQDIWHQATGSGAQKNSGLSNETCHSVGGKLKLR